jgi:transcription initiation factor TFIIE subunit alpha
VAREYYYIDYHRAIDAIKYRIHMVNEKVKNAARAANERKELSCSRCGSEWSTMEVLDSIDPTGRGSGFLCKKCGNLLVLRTTNAEADPQENDTPAQFNRQFGQILLLLQKIDEATVPASNPEILVAEARPVQRDSLTNPMAKVEVVDRPLARPSALKGTNTGLEKIEISITTDLETSAAEQAAEAERRARIAAQNQLPEWHTRSTVTGETIALGSAESTSRQEQDATRVSNTMGDDEDDDKKERNPTLDAYFEALRAEQERQAEEEESDEDDDDDFEEVVGNEVVSTESLKRIKVEEIATPTVVAQLSGEESDADDFEDAL